MLCELCVPKVQATLDVFQELHILNCPLSLRQLGYAGNDYVHIRIWNMASNITISNLNCTSCTLYHIYNAILAIVCSGEQGEKTSGSEGNCCSDFATYYFNYCVPGA